ncbi:CGNR zinc finger domain-containing protein [Streptomyces sp. NBC_01622]|uniref:CGNR zinc finger domain-containing protein n=1 Tax=Streptomyces sp. NBC_01622 TaxID=2975903 RepID=UPI00386A6845|nr:CGNR zinc finger domain-containing protein [Streptomyces sp. NBC_01622]
MADFVFVSGRLCLDLAGTMLWRRTRRTELLDSPEALALWIAQAAILDEAGEMTPHDLARVKTLREALYDLTLTITADGPDLSREDELALVNDAARLPVPRVQLDCTGTLSRLGGVDEVLGYVARDAIELLGSPHAARVKECANPECTRLFVDLSRSAARRWCGMAECGNRHKAASYRERRKTTVPSTA